MVSQAFKDLILQVFKAGEEQGIVKGSILGVKDITLLSKEELDELNARAEVYIQGIKQTGRREVMEWGDEICEDQTHHPAQYTARRHCGTCRFIKLTEWGLR